MKQIGWLVLLFCLAQLTYAQAKISLPYFFSDNMVIQRDKPVKLWGWSATKKEFSIELASVKKKVKPAKDGSWKIEFPAIKAGGPYQINFEGDTVFSLKNILIGDVWFASGQSNMEWNVSQSFNSAYELSVADDPNIRCFSVPKKIGSAPLNSISAGKWIEATYEQAAKISGVAYFFAKNIRASQHVPIGIINAVWGGTAIESWTSIESIGTHPDFAEKAKAVIESRNTSNSIEVLQKLSADERREWETKIQSIDRGYIEKWYSPEFKPQGWHSLLAPGYWEDNGLPDFDGVVWMNKTFYVPPSMINKRLVLNLEVINDNDITWINGKEVGRITWNEGRRIYDIPTGLLHEGENKLVVRVLNRAGKGGFKSKKEYDLCIQELMKSREALTIPLDGQWLFKETLPISEYPKEPEVRVTNALPSCIYNTMIAPFRDLPVKGFIWYQGETNSWRAYQYRSLFPLMINDWRKQFSQGDLPFLFAQLAGFTALTPNPEESYLAELREAQTMALQLPNTGMVVTIDVGNPYDVHPTNKQEVGRRFALEAERTVYGKPELQTSPTYKSMRVEGNKIYISFTNAANGLKVQGERLGGFAISGDDKKFVWGDARIEGNEVVVSSDRIQNPVAVRYAWTGSPVESNNANLYNKEGLPASPFRTDNWEPFTLNHK